MCSCGDTPKGWVAPFGYPRINACSRLPVAFRSVPRPSSPPGAKASTECPYFTRNHAAMHRSKPCLSRPQGRANKLTLPIQPHLDRTHDRPHPITRCNQPNVPERSRHATKVRFATWHAQRRTRTRFTLTKNNNAPQNRGALRAAQHVPRKPELSLRSPIWRRPPWRQAMETDGLEPTTPCLQSRCSPS